MTPTSSNMYPGAGSLPDTDSGASGRAVSSCVPRRSLFTRAVAWLLMATLSLSSTGQAIAQAGGLIRNAQGQPLTGYTANGSFVQGGVVVGLPVAHQLQHDLQNPSLWSTGAVSFSNHTDPSFTQPTIDQMMAAIAPPVDPGGLYLGRLYLNPTNPYSAGGVLSAPPSATPETGAAPPGGPLIDNQEHYARALAHAQANLGDRSTDITRWSSTDPALGNGVAYLAKTHNESSAELRNLHFESAPGRAIFGAAQSTTPGAVGYYVIQGEQAKTHLANIQQQNARLLGSRIFFTQQRLNTPAFSVDATAQAAATTGVDPNAGAFADFEAALGNPNTIGSNNNSTYNSSANNSHTGTVNPDFQIGYIQPDGQAHTFDIHQDPHFQQAQQPSWNNGGHWDAGDNSASGFNHLVLGRELAQAASGHWAGVQAVADIDFSRLSNEALFMQGLDLRRHVVQDQWALLDGLKNGQIAPGHPQYEQALALTRNAFTQAYQHQVEYNEKPRHSKESAAWQAQQLQFTGVSDRALFEHGYDLFDRKGNQRGEQLLRDLQDGKLQVGSADYNEARALAEARFRMDHQQALEPPKKSSWLKQLVAVVIAAVVVYFTAGAASGWAATAMSTTAGATTAAGVAATAIGSAVGAYAGAVVGAGIQTGSLSKALAAGENSLKGGVASILVNTALAAAGVSAGNLGGSLGVSQQVGEAVYSTVTNSLTQSLAYGTSFGDALLSNAINAGVDVIAANVAGVIGQETAVGSFEKYAAHAALGCGVGMVKSGSSSGCVPAAAGAVAGHMAADGIKVALNTASNDPTNANPIALMAAAVPGRTLDDGVTFLGGLIGGAAATLAGDGKNVQTDFGLGQGAAQNAIQNNYLKYDEAKKLQALKEQELKGQCTGTCKAEIQRLETVDRQRNEQLAQCEGSIAAGCQQAFKDVRMAAADYVRKDVAWQQPGQEVLRERLETLKLAQGTTDGKLQGAVQGYWEALKETAASVKEGAQTLYAAAKGDKAAWDAIKQGAGAAADYVGEPSNWPYLLGAMTPQQREQLAAAYETGNGTDIGRLMAQQVANMPIGGGPMGSIKKIDDVIAAAGKGGNGGAAIPSGFKPFNVEGLPAGSTGVVNAATGEIRVLTPTGQLTGIPPTPIPSNINASVVPQSATGIKFGGDIQAQGLPFETHLEGQLPVGTRLPPNTKTFDFFDRDTGVATSAKTLDTTTVAKITDPTQVYYSLKTNVDATVNFAGANVSGGAPITSSMISGRVVQVAIPEGTTAAQWAQINKAIEYANANNVTLKIVVVKP